MFQESQGKPLLLGETTIEQIFHIELPKGLHHFRLEFVSSKTSPTQGIRLKSESARINIAGKSLKDVVLWTDTSPTSLDFYISGKSVNVLKIWNVWKIDKVMHAWIGNAGMVIEANGRTWTFRCNDGPSETKFEDLVVRLTVTPVQRASDSPLSASDTSLKPMARMRPAAKRRTAKQL